jgi:5-oxoprolinase (ATP-hydrolysing)
MHKRRINVNGVDEEQIRKDLSKLYEEGFRSIAICLMHSYTFPRKQR